MRRWTVRILLAAVIGLGLNSGVGAAGKPKRPSTPYNPVLEVAIPILSQEPPPLPPEATPVDAPLATAEVAAETPPPAPAPDVNPLPPTIISTGPDNGCSTCGTSAGCDTCGGDWGYDDYDGGHSFLDKLKGVFRGPNGGRPCNMPIGCSTHAHEKCFKFGSCHQFFGKRASYVPPPGIIPPPTTPCEYGTWMRW